MTEGITRPSLQNTIRQIEEASGSLDAEEKARQKKAIKLFSDFASGSSDVGTLIGGFQTLAQEAKAADAKKKGKPNPIPAKATSTLGATSNVQSITSAIVTGKQNR